MYLSDFVLFEFCYCFYMSVNRQIQPFAFSLVMYPIV